VPGRVAATFTAIFAPAAAVDPEFASVEEAAARGDAAAGATAAGASASGASKVSSAAPTAPEPPASLDMGNLLSVMAGLYNAPVVLVPSR